MLEYERNIEELEVTAKATMQSQLTVQDEKHKTAIKVKEREKDTAIVDLKKSKNKNMDMTDELMNMKIQYDELEKQHQNAKKQLIFLTQKVEEKQREMVESKVTVVEKIEKNHLEEKIKHLNIKIKDNEETEFNYNKLMIEHQHVKNKLNKCEIELRSKEAQLENKQSMLKYSESRIVKIEEFVNSQKQRICTLEEKLQESEQVSLYLK